MEIKFLNSGSNIMKFTLICKYVPPNQIKNVPKKSYEDFERWHKPWNAKVAGKKWKMYCTNLAVIRHVG